MYITLYYIIVYYIVWYYITLHSSVLLYSIIVHYIILHYIMLYCTILHYITLYFIRSIGNYGKHRVKEKSILKYAKHIEQEKLVPIMMSTFSMVTMVNKMLDSHGILTAHRTVTRILFSRFPTANQRRLNGELKKKTSLEWWLVRVSIPMN